MGDYKQVATLKKELDDLQKELDGLKTPATVPSVGISEPGDMSLGPSAVSSPILGPIGANPGKGVLALTEEKEKQQTERWRKLEVGAGAEVENDNDSPKLSDFKLDDKDGSSQSGTEPESDTSAVVVEKEDGQEKEVEFEK